MKIKEESDVQSSFRANLSRFAFSSSPPSASRPPKRPSPDPNPNNPPSTAPLAVTVAVAQPRSVLKDGDPLADDNARNGSNNRGSGSALRQSHRKRKGVTPPMLDTGRGDGGSANLSKKRRNRNTRAPEVDLSHLGGLPEYLAVELDGTFLTTMRWQGLLLFT